VTQRTESFVLLLFGGGLVRLATGDALLRYVRPVARPWVLIAGLAVVLLALWTLVASFRASDTPDPERPEHDEHGHPAGTRTAWLVVAPVVAILVIAPPALGSFSASRAPTTVAEPADVNFPALTGADPVPVSMIDFATRALWDSGRTLSGRRVSVTGFVLRSGQGGFVLARLVITCCAADARPIEISVRTGAPPPVQDGWVTVTGSYTGVSPVDATLPELTAQTITPIAQPANPYDD